MRTVSNHKRLLAVLVAASFVFAACGDDDDEADSSTTATTAATEESTAPTTAATEESTAPTTAATEESTAPTTAATEESTAPTTAAEGPAEPTGTPFVVGALLELTGPATSPASGDMDVMIQAWADHLNANGGINGHPVQVEIEDTAGEAATALAALDKILAKDPAVLFLNTPAVESSLAERLGQTGLAVIGRGFNPGVWGGEIVAFGITCGPEAPIPCALPNAFPVTTTFSGVVEGQSAVAKALGATKAAAVVCAEVDSCSAAEPIFQAAMVAAGLEVLPGTKASTTAADYTSECVFLVQENVDFIQVNLSGAAGPRLISDCLDQGYGGFFGASGASLSQDMLIPGITLGGPWFEFPYFADHPGAQEYRDVMTEAGVTEDSVNNTIGPALWMPLQVLAKAQANLAEEFTPADVLANMYTVQDETLDGLIPPVTFTEGQPAPARLCYYPIVWDGESLSNLTGEDAGFECIK